MSTYCFDIDGTICEQVPYGSYPNYDTESYPEVVDAINQLYDKGNKVIMFTARGTTTGINWREFTEYQLNKWGVKYHELQFGKPEADYFIDDRGLNVLEVLGLVSTG
jgi:histidinol phosphatase-like enzyme